MSPTDPKTTLPHHKLVAYQLALQFVQLIARTRIANAHLRQQARKSASSCALNTAEGAARLTLADESRAYGIALTECCEACAAVEISGALGASSAADVQSVLALGCASRMCSAASFADGWALGPPPAWAGSASDSDWARFSPSRLPVQAPGSAQKCQGNLPYSGGRFSRKASRPSCASSVA
jgi:four helix bundle protein